MRPNQKQMENRQTPANLVTEVLPPRLEHAPDRARSRPWRVRVLTHRFRLALFEESSAEPIRDVDGGDDLPLRNLFGFFDVAATATTAPAVSTTASTAATSSSGALPDDPDAPQHRRPSRTRASPAHFMIAVSSTIRLSGLRFSTAAGGPAGRTLRSGVTSFHFLGRDTHHSIEACCAWSRRRDSVGCGGVGRKISCACGALTFLVIGYKCVTFSEHHSRIRVSCLCSAKILLVATSPLPWSCRRNRRSHRAGRHLHRHVTQVTQSWPVVRPCGTAFLQNTRVARNTSSVNSKVSSLSRNTR